MAPAKKRKCPLTRPKTAAEIRDMKKAVEMTGRIFREMRSPFGRSEADVAKEIRRLAREFGAGLSFMPIVASGKNSGFVHHRPGKKIVRENETVIFDIGVRFNGQCSDITRMHVPNGKMPGKIYRDAMDMQKRCIMMARPGKSLKEIHEFYKKLMKKKGYDVKHGIGHGIGAHVHERVGVLKPRMVITVEPGIYEKKMGCRVEDMVIVTRGKPVLLSKSIIQASV